MEISKLTPVQKSVMLAKLMPEWDTMGYPYDQTEVFHRETGKPLFLLTKNTNFYTVDEDGNPHSMAWAWRVLNWAITRSPEVGQENFHIGVKEMVNGFLLYWATRPLAEAQTAWLDEILELAIGAGMVQP